MTVPSPSDPEPRVGAGTLNGSGSSRGGRIAASEFRAAEVVIVASALDDHRVPPPSALDARPLIRDAGHGGLVGDLFDRCGEVVLCVDSGDGCRADGWFVVHGAACLDGLEVGEFVVSDGEHHLECSRERPLMLA